MKSKFFFLLSFLFCTVTMHAQSYNPVDDGSKVAFTIKNFGFNTPGTFSGLKGKITFNPLYLSEAKFDVRISASTIDTDNTNRDKDLREKLYFDVASFPEISLVSTKIDKTNKTEDGYYYFTGNLTIKGVTKPISFPFKAERKLNDYVFTGEFSINRLDYGVGEKSTVLSQKVTVNLNVVAKPVKP